MNKLAALALLAFPAFAGAETITFEADSEILVVRKSQRSNQTLVVELLGPRDGSILCVALDSDGKPVATTTGYAQMASVSFRDLDAATVDRVVCRYN